MKETLTYYYCLDFFIYIYIFIFVPPLHIFYKTPVKTIIYIFNVKHILYINDKHFWNISVTLSLLKSFLKNFLVLIQPVKLTKTM